MFYLILTIIVSIVAILFIMFCMWLVIKIEFWEVKVVFFGFGTMLSVLLISLWKTTLEILTLLEGG